MIVYNGKLLKKIFKLKIKARPVTTWLSNITFHLLLIGLQAVVAINSESCQTSFPSFCTPPSEVSVLCNLNVSRHPFLRQVVDLDLLLCTGFDWEHAVLFVCHSFTQIPMTDSKIEQSNGRGFGLQEHLANLIKNFISHKNKK